jgi:excisionase family DNA binding protein
VHNGVTAPHTPTTAALPTADSLTIGQAAALTGLHKNTIRAYIKQGRLAAVPVRGKYGQEYRIGRAAVIALSALVSPLAEGAGAGVVRQAVPTPHEPTDEAAGVMDGAEAPLREGLGAAGSGA